MPMPCNNISMNIGICINTKITNTNSSIDINIDINISTNMSVVTVDLLSVAVHEIAPRVVRLGLVGRSYVSGLISHLAYA